VSGLRLSSDRALLGERALRALAVIRLVNGILGLLAPSFLARRTGTPAGDTAPHYGLRMFGIRTVVLGADLLLTRGAVQQRARTEAVVIHASDTVSAVVGGLRGDLPKKPAVMAVAISATNTVLAVVARVFAPPPRP
jgi:uncharacterized protein YjeT (DUF2065 family)